ncbi:putative alpha/beta superfamily hydrolase [Aquimarina sp. EL_43]|uniref:alpha/beta hydrolase n=1 Tax=Aquimarina TaxID=290174 RepID=UPI00047088C2|nr:MULTISPECIES: alpha/beta hydrolase-fold protein [Aquimarina]MBG6132034.1 putative alpha/beta superfamily hydrolase [Aquimarina sp. EL_35]MBG6149598.1 putative alpha/beta superfamily hydrolase [Aquimarina sp. EL_32]MBG6170139.1 putative alpha/beta superfamily hydrolase [Aquimarina sp. EL_43]
MKKSVTLIIACIFVVSSYGQTIYESFRSIKLDQSRELKIQLPRNYKKNEDKIYPLIIVLDGDYLFEPVAGNVDYFSYWEDMPESIVVGVNQRKTREDDCRYDTAEFLPTLKGAEFYEFIGQELVPYLNENYRTAQLKIIVGHDYTANFINYFLFKDNPIFQGYICISPELGPPMGDRISSKLETSSDIWYYLATATNDADNIKKSLIALDEKLSVIENPEMSYFFDNFEESSHYTLVGKAIPNALEGIFEMYRPISKKTYKEVLLTLETSPYDYLVDMYKTTEKLYGIKRKIRINDFIAVSTALEKKENWSELEPLGKLAIKEHSDLMLGHYYLGMFYEQTGEPKKAMRAYESGFQLSEVAFLTKDYMLDKVNKIKEDFGW